jgi:hypothetical protein
LFSSPPPPPLSLSLSLCLCVCRQPTFLTDKLEFALIATQSRSHLEQRTEKTRGNGLGLRGNLTETEASSKHTTTTITDQPGHPLFNRANDSHSRSAQLNSYSILHSRHRLTTHPTPPAAQQIFSPPLATAPTSSSSFFNLFTTLAHVCSNARRQGEADAFRFSDSQ